MPATAQFCIIFREAGAQQGQICCSQLDGTAFSLSLHVHDQNGVKRAQNVALRIPQKT